MRGFTAAALLLALFSSPVLAVEPPIDGRYPAGHFLDYRPLQKVVRKAAVKKAAKVAARRKAAVRAPQSHQDGLWARFSKPARYVAGRLVCAVNVNLALAEKGIRGTGSRLARSFLSWGRPSGPVPGAIAVYARGRDPRKGHVAIVSRVVNGKVFVWNPSSRGRGWREVAYPKPAIAYRRAS